MPYEDHLDRDEDANAHRHSRVEVLWAFLKLGLISFGGPVAHLGYFRNEFVARRWWLDDVTYTDLVALCQFLPGPASSQVGFSIGLMRAGYTGALAAWVGFTLPSAIMLVLVAMGAQLLTGPSGAGLLHGLKLVATAIVAQAVLGMARTLCPDIRRASIALLAMGVILYSSATMAQIGILIMGAVAGLLLCRTSAPSPPSSINMGVSRRAGLASIAAYFSLLMLLPLWRRFGAPSWIDLFDAFYRSGALVFGGGHVILPLLRDAFVTPGWVSDDRFLAGYGAAQAVPGPLSTFAAYLGAVVQPMAHGIPGAIIGLVGIFLPGMLLLVGTLPFWDLVRGRADMQGATRGINAAVVGLLGAVLYSPVATGSIDSGIDLALAVVGFLLLTYWHVRPILIVLLGTLSGMALARVG